MRSLSQEATPARHGPGVRPLVIGALTCGALLLPVGGAQASHRMANGMLCPHAAGEPVAGEAVAPPGPSHATSAGPIAPATTRAAPARPSPATKSGSSVPSQRAASQAPAQRPAVARAQSQAPAVATVPAAVRTATVTPAPRAVPVARPAQVRQPRAARTPVARKALRAATTRHAVSDPVGPIVVADMFATSDGATVTQPAATSAQPAARSDDRTAIVAAIVLGLLALGVIGIAGTLAGLSRIGAARRARAERSFSEAMDAAIEAELQAMICGARPRTSAVRDELDDDARERELGALR